MEFSEIKKRLANKTVGIAGAGGLGSNCAVALVRSGIVHLKIADFDRVDNGNLNRQYYFSDQIGEIKVEALKNNLQRINPKVQVSILPQKLTPANIPSFFNSVDVLVEAFDSADQKEMLLELALEYWPSRPLVVGSGLAGYGMNNMISQSQFGQLYICGDNQSESTEQNPPLAPRVGVVANMQANVVLEILLDEK